MSSPFKILFVSRHNSVRAPIAVALTQKIAGSAVEAKSAGTEFEECSAEVAAFVKQLTGMPVPEWCSLDDMADQSFDLIITLCDKSHTAIAEHPLDTQHIRWDMHRSNNTEQLKHLEIELSERLHLMLQVKHLL
jgi:protein-tyrosine-phosphatase